MKAWVKEWADTLGRGVGGYGWVKGGLVTSFNIYIIHVKFCTFEND
jgi:hypothetical protein